MEKIFKEAELEFFEKASFDRNPLHRNDSYARKTQFGQKVVYGVYAALFCLGEWLAGRNTKLSRIKGEFKKPLLLHESYDLNFLEKADATDVTVSRGGSVYLKLRIWRPTFVDDAFRWPDIQAFVPRSTAAEDIQYGPDSIVTFPTSDYACGWSNSLAAPPAFRLRRDQLPFEQLTAFLWSSYFMGMEVPGRQALYSSFEFIFESSTPTGKGFQLSPMRIEMDRRFNRVTIQGAATGISAYTLMGFERPRSVRTSLKEIQNAIGSGKSMAGKRVLITGASRGFGAVMAQAIALQGAQVLISFNQSGDEAEELAESIAAAGTKPILIQGDASTAQVWKRYEDELKGIDILINNASPAIPAVHFKNQCTADLLSFVDRSLGIFLEPCAQIIPKMNAGGIIVHISSIYVKNPEAGFSHYIAAKAAAEAMMHSLATEYPALRFLIFRASKMLTDQTNTVLPAEGISSPVQVAKSLLAGLNNFTTSENIRILESW